MMYRASILALLGAAVYFIAGCSLDPITGQPTTAIKKPTEMSDQELCYNATLVVRAMQLANVQGVYPQAYASAVSVRDEVCVAANTGAE